MPDDVVSEEEKNDIGDPEDETGTSTFHSDPVWDTVEPNEEKEST